MENQDQLSLSAKEAIRAYMLKIVAPIFGISSVLLFFLGYFVKDVGEKNAYSSVQEKIFEMSATAAIASLKATEATQQAQDLLVDVQNMQRRLRQLAEKEELQQYIAGFLLTNEEFKRSIVEAADKRLEQIEVRLPEIEKELIRKIGFDSKVEIKNLKTKNLLDVARGESGGIIQQAKDINSNQQTWVLQRSIY